MADWIEPAYFRYWGKARKEGEEGAPYHLLPYHCLDVAAVGKVLLEQHPQLANHLATSLHWETAALLRYAPFFLALHDLGKFAESFQRLRPDLLELLQQRQSEKGYSVRHDTLGFVLWAEALRSRLAGSVGGRRPAGGDRALDYWLCAVTGHHGKPPQEHARGLLRDYFATVDVDAALAFTQDAAKLILGGDFVTPPLDQQAIMDLSWLLAGFAILCDWLGSNSNDGFFPYQSEQQSLEGYWRLAQGKACRVLDHAGILPNRLRRDFVLADCFPLIAPQKLAPTPLQQQATTLPLTVDPQLLLLEDVTGAGKTEAAMLLAYRLMRITGANGFYFALPTMATANGMYRRMKTVYRRLFAEDAVPSLVLAHSARELSDEFTATVLPETNVHSQDYGDDTASAEALCSAWLKDHGRAALLAAAGVGTIDQALLAVLPSRHQSLRLLGLMGKVLIVDEVHAFDAYTNRLLRHLLTLHAKLGGSAILLSATLPQAQRQAFVDAFAHGRDAEARTLQKTGLQDYPLLTHWQPVATNEMPLGTSDRVRRTVQVELIHAMDGIPPLIGQALAQRRCVCWIRNTVADARKAYLDLSRDHPQWQIDLFHARFALQDRIDIENGVLDSFGPDSGPSRRQGRLLIASQVVEQSLDLDFDVLITDLAPIDLIVQRAGRLCRHPRDTAGNRIDGTDWRGAPTLYVLAPDPDGAINQDWFTGFFEKAGKVYPHHGQLWLTANLLKQRRRFTMPEDARLLIESVYGDDAQTNIPQGLRQRSDAAQGDGYAAASLAAQNALNFDCGYRDSVANHWWEEALTPTRLGEDTTTVYLARWQDGVLQPWAVGGGHVWQRSAVQLRTALAAKEGAYPDIGDEQMARFKESLPGKGKWGVLLPLMPCSDGGWTGWLRNGSQLTYPVCYHGKLGLYEGTEDGGGVTASPLAIPTDVRNGIQGKPNAGNNSG